MESKNGPKNIIWQWKPEIKSFDDDDMHRFDDIAEEYVVEKRPQADSGIILWGKYHGEWHANPSGRPVIVKLLHDSGMDLYLPTTPKHSLEW